MQDRQERPLEAEMPRYCGADRLRIGRGRQSGLAGRHVTAGSGRRSREILRGIQLYINIVISLLDWDIE
jgi:hypothetical protein